MKMTKYPKIILDVIKAEKGHEFFSGCFKQLTKERVITTKWSVFSQLFEMLGDLSLMGPK
jgi:hypothetical protein